MLRDRHGEDAAWPAVLSSALLAAAVAAAVAAAMLRFGSEDPVRIASVRLGELTAAYAVKAAEAESAPEAAADARRWAAALERALVRVARRRGVALLPARAVAAGAPDLTAEVEAEIEAELARSAADGSAPRTAP